MVESEADEEAKWDKTEAFFVALGRKKNHKFEKNPSEKKWLPYPKFELRIQVWLYYLNFAE